MKFKTDGFIKVLNDAFHVPFLPSGFFHARPRPKGHGKGIQIYIGDVDVEIDGKGRLVAHGTNMKTGRKWKIEPI